MVERLYANAEENPQLKATLGHFERKPRPWWRALGRVGVKPKFRPPAAPEPPLQGTGFPVEGFFVARDDEVDQRLVDEGPHGQVTAFEAKNMSPVEIGTLGEILGAGTYAELCDRMTASHRAGEGGECGLFLVAPEITDRLAALDDLAPIVAAWNATDELARWNEEDVSYVLEGVQPLAVLARAEGRELWVWWWI